MFAVPKPVAALAAPEPGTMCIVTLSGGMTIPDPLKLGTPITVKGTISADCTLTSATAQIRTTSGTVLYGPSTTLNTDTFDLATWDNALMFSKLPVGSYSYVVRVTDSSGAITVHAQPFTVNATGVAPPPQTPCAVTLSGGMTIPDTLKPGTPVTVTGTVNASGCTLTAASAQIRDDAGNVVYGPSATLSGTTFSVSTWDNALMFSKLAVGAYTYLVTATDSSGATTTLSSQTFAVATSPTPTPTPTPTPSSTPSETPTPTPSETPTPTPSETPDPQASTPVTPPPEPTPPPVPCNVTLTGGMTVPNPLATGSGVTVKGTVTATGCTLASVTAQIKNSAGAVAYGPSASPNAASFNVATWDNALMFSKLKAGSYTYSVIATDSTGKTTTLSVQSFIVATPTPKMPTSAQMVANLKSSGVCGSATAVCQATAQILLNAGYSPAFVAGMLGNLLHEGNAGELEVSSNKSSSEGAYLYTMDQYFSYHSLYSGKYIYKLNLTTVVNLTKTLSTANWTWRGKAAGFGMGSMQWTFARTRTLALLYQKTNGGKSSITSSQTIAAEAQMVVNELRSSYSSIYPTWQSANKANLNSQAAAYDAGYKLCYGYSKPNNTASQAIARGNSAKAVYAAMVK